MFGFIKKTFIQLLTSAVNISIKLWLIQIDV